MKTDSLRRKFLVRYAQDTTIRGEWRTVGSWTRGDERKERDEQLMFDFVDPVVWREVWVELDTAGSPAMLCTEDECFAHLDAEWRIYDPSIVALKIPREATEIAIAAMRKRWRDDIMEIARKADWGAELRDAEIANVEAEIAALAESAGSWALANGIAA
jgi:hypothetical protein